MKRYAHPLYFLLLLPLFGLMLGCGFVSFVQNPAAFDGIAYWAAQTSTPIPTVTQFLGMSTPVYADTPVPQQITLPPQLIRTTATPIVPPVTATPVGFSATPFWVTTTPVYITETPQPPVTTTPRLPMIGFTTPEPLETPYYRLGSFYMNSDVYIGSLNGVLLRLLKHETQVSPHDPQATYHYLTIRVTNRQAEAVVMPLSDLFFIREVQQQTDQPITGRWTAQNEPLIARNLPSYETQQLTPLPSQATREFVMGFVLPNGELETVGFITNWQHDMEGGIPIWFYLKQDPLGSFVDAVDPPPPTPALLDDPLNSHPHTGGGDPSDPISDTGLWPTTGVISRGFGCHAFYTGIHGAGYGCPADKPWFHNGVDVANSVGTAVWSPVDGTFLFAGPNSNGPDCAHLAGSQPPHQGLGNFQKIRGSSTLHYFGHLSRFVAVNGSVAARQTVAEMGSTGCSTGSHLHWIVYENGSLVDPAIWAGGTP